MLIQNPPVQITDSLWMLGTNRYPLYVFRGRSEGAIFEGGVGAMGPVLREQLDQLEVAADFVRQVVVTHAHPDHVMAVPLFREMFPDVAVLASDVAAKTLAAEKAVAMFSQMDEAVTGSLLEEGLIEEKHRPRPLDEKQIAVDRVIGEGDQVVIEDVAFDVLHTPGHSDCSLSFFEPKSKVLLISDATGYYLPEEGYWWPCYFSDYGAYVDSIRRLAGLDAEVLGLSHNAVFRGAEDVKAYFQGVLAATEQYHQRILDETAAGKGVRQIAEEFGSEVYEKSQLLPLDFFQKSCGLLVKKSLKHEGVGER